MACREFNLVLHLPVLPPVEVGGDQAEEEAVEDGKNQLDEKCPPSLSTWEEEREEEV